MAFGPESRDPREKRAYAHTMIAGLAEEEVNYGQALRAAWEASLTTKGSASGFEGALANAAEKITSEEQGSSGHRKIRRVPLDWKHPQDEKGNYIPLFDSREAGSRYTIHELSEMIDDFGSENYRDIESSYMPVFGTVPEEEMGICLYETTTEGTPLTPVFPDTPEGHKDLAAYAAEHATTIVNETASEKEWGERFFGNLSSNNLMEGRDDVFEVMPGSDITATIAEARALSGGKNNRPIKFNFNGVTVTALSTSDPNLLYRDWDRALRGCIDKNVGPNPEPVLTEEEKASDARIEAENKRRCEEERARYQAEQTARRHATEAKLADAPSMEVSDPSGWQGFQEVNQEGMGAAIIAYADRWARLMQREMAHGQKLEDVAQATSHEADIEGITGSMHNHAVSVLAMCWKHGDQLRQWHNLDNQIGDEGEKANEEGAVLNSAVLRIG